MSPARILGNCAAVAALPIVLAVAYDYIATLLGWRPVAYCAVIQPVVEIAGYVGVLLTTVALIVWAFSIWRGQLAWTLALGGVVLFLTPQILPHYLGASCIH